MSKLKSIIKFVANEEYRFRILCARGVYNHLSDADFLKKKYNAVFEKTLDLKNPKTFNEKLQWLKLYYKNKIYTTMVDKYEVKDFVSKKIGEEYVIPAIGVWDKFEDIDFDALPEQFVLKCTHDSGGLVICKNKAELDIEVARKKIRKSLEHNYYLNSREYPYKNVPPRILAELFISDNSEHQKDRSLVVYKVMCFGGVPKIIQVIQDDKKPNESIDYFDSDWNLLPIKQNFPNSKNHIEKPEKLSEMLELSAKLSDGMPFVRTDWYIVEGKLLFSEYTFYSDAGFARFEPAEWDYKLGEWIDLPQEN